MCRTTVGCPGARTGQKDASPSRGQARAVDMIAPDRSPSAGDDALESARFALAALLDDLSPHEELDLRTLAYHLRQSDATAADGYHHAAINEARSFIEALIVGMARVARGDADGEDARSSNVPAFRVHRRHLIEAGCIDTDENELLHFVYGIASAKGSHHGVTDEAWAELARRIVFVTGRYLILRYGEWKDGRRACAAPREVGDRRRKRWFSRLFRRQDRGRSEDGMR